MCVAAVQTPAEPATITEPRWAASHRLCLAAEFTGSLCLLFAAATAIRLTAPGSAFSFFDSLPNGRTLFIGCCVAGTVAGFSLTALGRRSCQLNPAITSLAWLRGSLPARGLVALAAAQLCGSFAGIGIARLIWGSGLALSHVRYALIQPRPGLGVALTGVGEFGMTCILLTGVSVLRSRPPRPAAAGVFAVIMTMIWLGGPWSGASFNPIRNFAPAVWSGTFRLQEVYLVAPMLAALAIAAIATAISRSRVTRVVKPIRTKEQDGYPSSSAFPAE